MKPERHQAPVFIGLNFCDSRSLAVKATQLDSHELADRLRLTELGPLKQSVGHCFSSLSLKPENPEGQQSLKSVIPVDCCHESFGGSQPHHH